jgi:CheY-like chemotaxis protein
MSAADSDALTTPFDSSVLKEMDVQVLFPEDRFVQRKGTKRCPGTAAVQTLFRDEEETEQPEPSQPRESLNGEKKLPSLKGLRVLVVDDEPDSCELLTILLTHYGAEVTTAGSLRAAVKAFTEGSPDILVSDIKLPDGDGYALIHQIRGIEANRPEKVPALALTSYTQPEDRDLAIAAGFQMYVTKPVEPQDLVTAIATLARRP